MWKLPYSGAYTFTPGPAGEGTLALTELTSTFVVGRLTFVANVTRNAILYTVTTTKYGQAGILSDGIKFIIDTSGMESDDQLQVLYWDSEVAQPVIDAAAVTVLNQMLAKFGAPGAKWNGAATSAHLPAVSNGGRTVTWTLTSFISAAQQTIYGVPSGQYFAAARINVTGAYNVNAALGFANASLDVNSLGTLMGNAAFVAAGTTGTTNFAGCHDTALLNTHTLTDGDILITYFDRTGNMWAGLVPGHAEYDNLQSVVGLGSQALGVPAGALTPFVLIQGGAISGIASVSLTLLTNADLQNASITPKAGYTNVVENGALSVSDADVQAEVEAVLAALQSPLPLPANAAKETGGNLDEIAAAVARATSGGAAIFDGSTVTANQSSSTSNGGLTYIGSPTGTNPASANVKSGAAFAPNTVLRGCFRLNITLNGGSFSGGQFWAGFCDATADTAHLIEGKFIGVAFNTAYGGNIAACGLTAKISNGGYAIQNIVPANDQIVVVWINPSTGAYAIMAPNGTVHTGLGANTGGFWSQGLLTVQAGCAQNVSGSPTWSMTGLVGLPAGIADPAGFEGAIDVFSTAGTPAYTQSRMAGSLSSIDGKIPAAPATAGKQDTGNTSLSNIDTKTPALNGDGGSPSHITNPPTDYPSVGTVSALATLTGTVATAAGQTVGNNALAGILSAVQAQVSVDETVWVDSTVNPPVYYVRLLTETEGGSPAVTWYTPGGSPASPTVSNLHAITDDKSIQRLTQVFAGNTGGGTGFSAGDIIIHGFGLNTALATPVVAYALWFNATTGLLLSTTPSNIVATTQLVSDATTHGSLSSILTALGSPAQDASLGGAAAAAAGNTGASTTNGFLRWLRDFWYARLGALTALLSLSVTIASDDAQFGVGATGITPNTGGTGLNGWLSSILYNVRGAYAALSGTLAMNLSQVGAAAFALGSRLVANSISVVTASDYGIGQTSGTLDNTVTTTLSLAPPAGAGTVTFSLASYSGSIVFQVTTPNGTFSLAASNRGNATLPAGNPSASQAGNFDAAIPAGATALIINAAGLTSGTVNGWISTRPGPPNSTPAIVLAAGTARAMMNVAASKWTQQSVANLAAGASFTGPWADCYNSASGSVGGSSSYPKEYRTLGYCDKTIDLYVDQSPDASTAYRSNGVSGAIPQGGTNYVAKITELPVSRYCRPILKNTSGSTSTSLYCGDAQVAA